MGTPWMEFVSNATVDFLNIVGGAKIMENIWKPNKQPIWEWGSNVLGAKNIHWYQ